MKHLLQLTVVCCLASFCLAWHRQRPESSNFQEGDSCTPSLFSLQSCGDRTLVGETVRELTEEDGFRGPNVCLTTKTYQVQTFSYSYRRTRFGRLYCRSTGACNGTMRNFTKKSVACCDGYTTSREEDSESGFLFYRHWNKGRKLRQEGCPIMLRDNIVTCLEDLGLTRFIDEAMNLEDLFDALQSNDSEMQFTIFAPPDEAFDNLGAIDSSLIEAHTIDARILSKRLFNGRFIMTLAENVSLHVGLVRKSRSQKQIYVNGVNITNADACEARNGIVHVVESLIPSSDNTIAQVLESDPEHFSTFSRLLEGADIMKFLRDPKKSRTVFAPNNDAFDDLPDGAVECLLREENSRYLQFLVLIHIVRPAEFSSTLAQRSHVPTFAWYWLLVNSTDSTITITREGIPILDADIPANNGVVHEIADVIVPPKIDFDKLCPPSTALPPVSTTQSPPIVPSGPLPTVIPPVVESGDGPDLPIIPIDETTDSPIDVPVANGAEDI